MYISMGVHPRDIFGTDGAKESHVDTMDTEWNSGSAYFDRKRHVIGREHFVQEIPVGTIFYLFIFIYSSCSMF